MWLDGWHEVAARRLMGVRPSTIGLQLLAAASEAAALAVIGVTPLGARLQALETLLSAVDVPNNECWATVLRADGAWEWQPRVSVGGRRCQAYIAGNTSTTPIVIGFEGVSSGAGTGASIAATVAGIARRYERKTSGASTGQQAGVSPNGVGTPGAQLQTTQLLVWGIRWPTDLSMVRVRVGMSASPNNVVWAATAPPVNTLDLRYDPGAGDTQVMLSSSDAATPLTAALTVPRVPVAGDWWDFAFSFGPLGASVQVWISVNGGVWTLCATRATSLPVATTGLYHHAGLETRENVAKVIGIGSCYLVAT